MIWKTSKRDINVDRALVMAIVNTTPDSFSDGGESFGVEAALRRAEHCVEEGADILDIGGESTRPGGARVDAEEEIRRVVPVIEAVAKRFDVPISVDTSKSEVAGRAIDSGAEIINDISSFRFDVRVADVAVRANAGLVLMHSRGEFETMHSQTPVEDIISEVSTCFRRALDIASDRGIASESIVLDVGIGFGKTQDQNLELLAKLGRLVADFPHYPLLIGTSRKSFIGRVLNDLPVNERLSGSVVTAAIAVWNGARIVRVHDVKETVETVRVAEAIKDQL